jgi:hypothetical protein
MVYLLPPLFPLIFYGFFQIFNFPQIRSFLIGIVFSIIILYFILNIKIQDYFNIVFKSINFKMASAIFGIIIFRAIFELSGSASNISNLIMIFPFPSIIFIIFIPMILGILTGYNLGAVALSYPLVEPFFIFTGINIIGISSLIFISALVGYLISPIHLCNILSSEYLKTDTTRMYKMYIPSVISILVIQIIFILIIF